MPKEQLRLLPPSLTIGSVTVTIEHLPGHTHGHVHMHIQPDDVLLVGDHLAGEGSVWIGPPDGHLDDYLAALDAIIASGAQIAAPGHGDPLAPAADAALRLKSHRLAREAQIIECLRDNAQSQNDLVATLYGGTIPDEAMWVARRTVQGHLQRLIGLGQIVRTWDAGRQEFIYQTVTN